MTKRKIDTIIPAEPGYNALYVGGLDEGEEFVVFKEPIIAWRITHFSLKDEETTVRLVEAISADGREPDGIEYPDGRVNIPFVHTVSDMESFENYWRETYDD